MYNFYVYFLDFLPIINELHIKNQPRGNKLHLPPPLFLVLTRLRSTSFAVPFGLVRLPRALEAPFLLRLKVWCSLLAPGFLFPLVMHSAF